MDLKEFLLDAINTIFRQPVTAEINTALQTKKIIDDTLLNFLHNDIIQGILMPFALTLVVIYFLTEIIDKMQINPQTFEFFLKSFIKLVVGILIVGNSIQIFGDINSVTSQTMKTFTDKITFSEYTMPKENKAITNLEEDVNEGDQMANIAQALWIGVMLLVKCAIDLLVKWVCYSRLVKIFVLTIFAPIGLSDVISGGFNSKGFGYLKNFIAVCLQGLVIIVITAATSTVLEALTKTMGNVQEVNISLFLTFLLSQIVIAGSIMGSEKIAKEIVRC